MISQQHVPYIQLLLSKPVKRFLSWIVILTLVARVVTACTPISAQITPAYDHVIILGFDGWGASSFKDANMPFLKSLLPDSAWTLDKRSILPTSSACNWATMFKGVGPEAHGYIDWDTRTPAFKVTYTDEKGNFPSLFSLYHKQFPEREMGYLYQWEGMKYIYDMDDFSYEKEFPVSYAGSEKMKEDAANYIREKKPGLAIFVWDYPDNIGHSNGWYSEDYMQELTHIDSIIEYLVDACTQAGIIDRTLFVITSDHGGHEKQHGQPLESDLETPFIIWGKGVKPGEISVPVMQYDVASILCDYFHCTQPNSWRGKSVYGIFDL